MEYYSALQKKEYATTRTKLEDIVLSVTSQSQKGKYCMIHLYEISKVVKFIKAKVIWWFSGTKGRTE